MSASIESLCDLLNANLYDSVLHVNASDEYPEAFDQFLKIFNDGLVLMQAGFSTNCESVQDTLTVTGTMIIDNNELSIPGLESVRLNLTLNFLTNGDQIDFELSGQLNATTKVIPVTISYDGQLITLELNDDSDKLLLSEISSIITNSAFDNYVPNAISFIGEKSLSGLSFVFSPNITEDSSYSITCSLASWTIVDNLIVLENVSFTLKSIYSAATQNLFFRGTVSALVDIGSVSFQVVIPLLGSTILDLYFDSSIPMLSNLADWIGIPNTIDDWPSNKFDIFELQSINIKFDYLALKLINVVVRCSVTIGEIQFETSIWTPVGNNVGWLFSGSVSPLEFKLGDFVENLASKFTAIELPQALQDETLDIREIGLSFNTATGNFYFSAGFAFPVGDENEVDFKLKINVEKNGRDYQVGFGGYIQIGGLIFSIDFEKEAESKTLVALFDNSQNNINNIGEETYGYSLANPMPVKSLVANISPSLANLIPESLAVELKDIIFAYANTDSQKTFVFVIDVAASVGLSSLPLVGSKLPEDLHASVDNLRLLCVSSDAPIILVEAINAQLSTDIALPVPEAEEQLKQGVHVLATLSLGSDSSKTFEFILFGSNDETQRLLETSTIRADATALDEDDAIQWVSVQKSIGPLYFGRIGLRYQEIEVVSDDESSKHGDIWFMLDASLTASGLTVALDGLAFGSSLEKFDPQFSLQGLGIDYKNDAVEIGGAFLMVDKGDDVFPEFAGLVIVRAEQLMLEAIGAYTQVDGASSLFAYAILDYPLGGPPFFFVTGFAGGFGYNRFLRLPTIDKVADFPLVKDVLPDSTNTKSSKSDEISGNIATKLTEWEDWITPSVGDYFVAAGIKFNSFKMIDSFALLTVVFGSRLEIDLIGLSTLKLEKSIEGQATTTLAQAELQLLARFVPDEGFLGVQAQLSKNSFVLSKDCHLTGGFAFYAWFKDQNAGDFALTLGGYNPKYIIPNHYPRVPALGFNWQVDPNLSLKGDAYFALTPHALMAGGHLEATWEKGKFKAWFKEGFDFIIGWQPLTYDASVYASIGASYTYGKEGRTHTITAELSANLDIWGPPFAGTAHIDLTLISFDIEFGNPTQPKPKALEWSDFRELLLPDDILTSTVKSGLNGSNVSGDVFNPQELCIEINSVIPLTVAILDEETIDGSSKLHIRPMNYDIIASSLNIEITNETGTINSDFNFGEIHKSVPSALWGSGSLRPRLNEPELIDNVLMGIVLTAKPALYDDEETSTNKADSIVDSDNDFKDSVNLDLPDPQSLSPSERAKLIRDSIENIASVSMELQDALRVEYEVKVDASLVDNFVDIPIIEQSSENT